RKLGRAIAEMDETQEPTDVDIIHVFGGSVWGLGADLALEAGSALALEVWRAGLVPKAQAFHMPDRTLRDEPVLLIAPDQAIERALRSVSDARVRPSVHLAAWGVLAPAAS